MISVERPEEPATFDAEVRKPGMEWLEAHPGQERPRDLWSPYLPCLADAFQNRCGYSALYIEEGTLDHYLSCANHRDKAYEWTNYRYASARMNRRKGTEDDRVLDPFEIGDGWFEILLPTLQMVATDRIPPEQRARADYTLRKMGLDSSEPIIRRRQEWYSLFRDGDLTLGGLRSRAPLIAAAVEKRLEHIRPDAFEGEQSCYQKFLEGRLTLRGLRHDARLIAEAVDAELGRSQRRRPSMRRR